MPQATVDALVDAGLHAVMTPRAVGGLEASVVEAIDVFAEIARADGSAGWCLMANAATIAFFGAWAPDDFAKTLFADGVPLAAGQFAPNGVATPEGDGYRITGNYNFGSGVRHSAWIGAGVVTEPADGTDPQLLFALMPAAEVQFTGNWDVLGLESTASWDYSIDDVWVPSSATFDFFAPVRRRGGAVYELGVMGLTSAGHAGFALGVVRRALDELTAIARSKQRMGSSAALRDSERFLIELANLEARARAAASWVHERFAAAERTALETGSADPTEIAAGPPSDGARHPGRRRRRPARLPPRGHRRAAGRPAADVLPRHPRRVPALLRRRSRQHRARAILAGRLTPAAFGERDDGVELGVGQRDHREAVALGEQAAVGELGKRAELVERDERQCAYRCDGYPVPTRILGFARRVVVLAVRIELGRIRFRGLDDLADAGDSRRLRVRVVEDRLLAALHLAHEVA